MSRFTVCTYRVRQVRDRERKILSIFVRPFEFSDEHLDEVIAPLFQKEGPFDAIHLTGFPSTIEAVFSMLTSESAVIKRIGKALPDWKTSLKLFTLNAAGAGIRCQQFDRAEIAQAEAIVAHERQRSLQALFTQRNGLIIASEGVHYAKPSKKHSTRFLRTANVLEDSSTALQIAFWLISVLPTGPVRRIVVDTSGIDSIAFALAYERERAKNPAFLPIIESHSSYGGLANLTVPDPDGTVFLISASTSGGLLSELIAKGAKCDQIVTLYFLGNETANAGAVLCNLTAHLENNPQGFPLIRNYDPSECPACEKHSIAIPIEGDQFSTEPPRIEEISMVLSDFPPSQRDTLSALMGTGLFKTFKTVDAREFEIYLDIEAFFDPAASRDAESQGIVDSIKVRFDRLVNRGMPIHLRRIIFTQYPGAKRLAASALDAYSHYLGIGKETGSAVQLIDAARLHSSNKSFETASLVISGCLDEYYELLGISRDLRAIHPGGNVTYLAPFFRCSSKGERTRREADLTFGEHGPRTFNLFSVVQIELPDCESRHSWLLEYDSLQEVVHWAELEGLVVPDDIRERITLLRNAPATGISQHLFWKSPQGNELQLASNFTLIPNQDGQRPVSQADVFVIAASLFHQYRQGVKDKPILRHLPYQRTVISPESFHRFSDGILQGALLRAARGAEIAYGNCNRGVSRRMTEFLLQEVDDALQGRGPALMEYLVALMIGRLTLHHDDCHAVLEKIATTAGLPDWIAICARYMLYQSR